MGDQPTPQTLILLLTSPFWVKSSSDEHCVLTWSPQVATVTLLTILRAVGILARDC